MPHFRLETNVPQEQIPSDLPAKLCDIISKSTGKPVGYVVVTVVGGVSMCWGGGNDPAAQATLMSIGALGPEENKKHSKALSDCITKAIGIRSDRMYILFEDKSTSDIGYKGTTFQELLG